MSSSNPLPDKGLVVFGAGLPRTGTNSLQVALQRLLNGPCYHMKSVFFSKGSRDTEFWGRAIRQNVNDEEFRRFLEDEVGVRSACDFPPSFYWKRLLRIFPDAKVVLSVRNPETWRKSVSESIMYSMENMSKFPMSLIKHMVGFGKKHKVPEEVCSAIPDGYEHSMISAVLAGDKESQEFFNKWNAEVIATVPKERLLIFEAKQGWGPLCEFLGVPVPEGEEYPRVNDTAEFRGKVDKIKIFSYGILVVASIIVALVLKRIF